MGGIINWVMGWVKIMGKIKVQNCGAGYVTTLTPL
jgi:hypothetical protein